MYRKSRILLVCSVVTLVILMKPSKESVPITYRRLNTLEYVENIRKAKELRDSLISLDVKLDKHLESLNEAYTELNRSKDLEDSIVSIIMNENGNLTVEYARKLAVIVVKVSREYSEKYGFNDDIPKLLSIIRVESTFNCKAGSKVGAKGLMQLMDRTGKHIASQLGIKEYKPFDPEQNIRVAWYYFNVNKDRIGEDKAIVAYNQGYRNLHQAVSRGKSNSDSYWSKVKKFERKFESTLKEHLK